jgi:hypothetical protein
MDAVTDIAWAAGAAVIITAGAGAVDTITAGAIIVGSIDMRIPPVLLSSIIAPTKAHIGGMDGRADRRGQFSCPTSKFSDKLVFGRTGF